MDKDLETCPVGRSAGSLWSRAWTGLLVSQLLASFRGPAHRAARCRQREATATKLASGVLHARRRHVLLNKEKWKFIAIHALHTVTLS